jgi:hypothetical protein
VAEVEPVGGRDVLDEVRAFTADGQEVEDPAPVVVQQHDRQLAPRGLDQPAEVMDQRDVADEEHDGTVCDRGDPEGGRDGPVDSVGPAVGEDARRALARREERLDVAHGHRGGDDHGRLGRERGPELGRDARLAEPGGRQRAGDRAGGGAVGALPAVEPRGVALLERDRLQRGPRIGGEDRRHRAARVLPGVLGVEGELQRLAGAVQPRAQRFGGRQVADADHELRLGCPLGVAKQRVVVRDRGAAAAGAGQRVGEQRDGGALGERRQRLAEPRVALLAAGHEHGLRARLELGPQAVDQRVGRPAGRPRPRHPRPAAGAPAVVLGQRPVVDQRLTQREVQVDGAGAAVDGAPERAAGELPQPAQPLRRGGVRVDLEEPLGGGAVELDLVDRLPGAELAELWRAVGGEDEQRHARLARLDDGGRVVGRGGPRGAGQRRRHAGGLRDAEGEEAGAALVQVRGRADPRLADEREHERGRARARRRARLSEAAAGELVDERPQAYVCVAGGHE